MIPWIREEIAEAWRNRKCSQAVEKQSLSFSTEENKNCEASNSNKIVMSSAKPNSSFINVINEEGFVIPIRFKSDITVQNIKKIAVKHFYGQCLSKPASNFHLIHAAKTKQLADDRLLIDEGITDSDELLLIKSRPQLRIKTVIANGFEDRTDIPEHGDILQSTSDLPIQKPKELLRLCKPVHLRDEYRKIYITLVRTSAKVLMFSSKANRCCEIIRKRLRARNKSIEDDPKMMKKLLDMGFSEQKLFQSILFKNFRMRVLNASECLSQRHHIDEDSEVSESTPSPESAGPSSSVRHTNGYSENKTLNLVDMVELSLKNLKQYKRLVCKPNNELIKTLVAKGFEREAVIQALVMTDNNEDNAHAWLLGDTKSVRSLDDGLDPEDPIYNAVMSSPIIRFSLNNPKVLLALLSVLENNKCKRVWMNDPDLGPVFTQMSTIVKSEKLYVRE